MVINVGDVLRWRVGRHKGEGDLVVERVRPHTVTIRGTGKRRSLRTLITLPRSEVEARCEIVRRA